MLVIFSLLYFSVSLSNVSGEDAIHESTDKAPLPNIEDLRLDTPDPDIDKALEVLETLHTEAVLYHPVGEEPDDEAEKIYDDMIVLMQQITETLKNSNHAYKFLKAKGLDRIVQQNLKVDYDKLKTEVLLLLKVLFDVAPTSTSMVIPITTVDRLLDVFENDNLALKAHALDVLYLWLPDNPKVQARVMKIKGLAPFYDQVSRLDTSVIKTLLDLFNSILKEHLKAREDNAANAVADPEKMKFYLRIGLLEHMSTPEVCNGLLNIFARTWTANSADNTIIVTVFDLVKHIKPFCMKIYRGKLKAKKLFNVLQEYVKEPENMEFFENNYLNVTDISLMIEDYVEKVKTYPKDEM